MSEDACCKLCRLMYDEEAEMCMPRALIVNGVPQYSSRACVGDYEDAAEFEARVVEKMSRYVNMEQWRVLTREKRVDILVLDMPLLDTRRDKNLLGTLIADLVLQVLSFVAQNERENIRSRQAQGIAAAKQRGVRFGREIKPLPNNFLENCDLWLNGHISGLEAARRCRMPQSTFYRKAGRFREDGVNSV